MSYLRFDVLTALFTGYALPGGIELRERIEQFNFCSNWRETHDAHGTILLALQQYRFGPFVGGGGVRSEAGAVVWHRRPSATRVKTRFSCDVLPLYVPCRPAACLCRLVVKIALV